MAELKRSSSMSDFQDMSKRDAEEGLKIDLKRLLDTCPEHKKEEFKRNFDGFQHLFSRFIKESGQGVEWDKISPPPKDKIKSYREVTGNTPTDPKTLLDKLVVLKLNGGLGTSMGCTGPKSVISVRNDLTFLDMTVRQIEELNKTYNCDVPLVLMNSFNTHEDTLKVLRKYTSAKLKIHCFQQSQYPRIDKESLRPIAKTIREDDLESYYPPGHGDIYESFNNSGLLTEFIQQGKDYVFVSNIDNLGANVDLHILNRIINPPDKEMPPEFVMEVTDKTRADVKVNEPESFRSATYRGGTLINYEGKIRLLEIAQVPKEHIDDFKAVKKFRIFNTNNLWINLAAIHRLVTSKDLHMEIIVNKKSLDQGLNIIQLETAVGAAIKNFEGALGINVPRSRFLPVKTTSDLFLVMSNLYDLKSGILSMSHQRQFPTTPLVKMTGDQFKTVKDFLKRFETIPDILELDHLTVSGDVTFGRRITLKFPVLSLFSADRKPICCRYRHKCLVDRLLSQGYKALRLEKSFKKFYGRYQDLIEKCRRSVNAMGTVIIIANHGDRIDIPSGSVLENKIVSGNLRILDH